MAKKKYYAVAVGRSPGVFTDWPTAEKQVKGFAGAKFKSFPTRIEAEAWLKNPVYQQKEQNGKKKQERGVSPRHRPSGTDTVIVYTDGGCINNPGPGGYGVVIEEGGKRREQSGGFRHTTNNRMEMMAAIVALRELQGCGKKIFLYSDSSYLVNGITKGWAEKWRRKGWRKSDGQPVLNVDLWQEILDLLDSAEVSFHWVKGHAGNELNERCDRLAVHAARQASLAADCAYERAADGDPDFGQRTL